MTQGASDPFKDKICIVTGAASGIGRAVGLSLAERGAIVALSDVNEDGLAETRRLIGQEGSNRIRTDRLDVADGEAIDAYASTIKESLGDADYVFNIAGLTRVGDFKDSPLSSFEKIMDVNFWGVVRATKAFLPQLMETKGGVVNISSLFGFIGYPGQADYCASKFAVRGFSEALSTELEGTGVRITSVHPGGVDTNIVRNAEIDAPPATGANREEMEETFKEAAITTPAQAADIILNGAAKGKRRVVVGRDAKLISFVQRLFPESYGKIMKRLLPTSLTQAEN